MIVATNGNVDDIEGEDRNGNDWKDLIVSERLSVALADNDINYDSLQLLTNKEDIELLLQELNINLKITEKIQFISSLLKSINKANNEQKIQHIIITKEEEDAQQQLILKNTMISKSIKQLNNNLKEIENVYTEYETNINDVFNDFIQIIESRKYQLLNGLKKISNTKSKYVHKQLNQYNNCQQQIHSVQRQFQQNLTSCSVNNHHQRKVVNVNLVNTALSNMDEIGIDNVNSYKNTDIQLDFKDVVRMKSMMEHFGQIYDNDKSTQLKAPTVYIKAVGSNFVEFVIIDMNEYNDMKMNDNCLFYEINYCFDQQNISHHVEHKEEEDNKWKTKQIRKILPMQAFKFYVPFNIKFDGMRDKILARFRICNNIKCSVYCSILSVHLFDANYIIHKYYDDMLCIHTKFIAVQSFMDNVATINGMMMFCDTVRFTAKCTNHNDDNDDNDDNDKHNNMEKAIIAGLKSRNEGIVDVHNRSINIIMNTSNVKRFRYFCLTRKNMMDGIKQTYNYLEQIIESIEEIVTIITMKQDQTDYWHQIIMIKNMMKEANDIFNNIGINDEFINLQTEVDTVLIEAVYDSMRDDEVEDIMEKLEEEEELKNNDEIIIEGYLQKQSLHLKKFRNRFIVFKNKCLYCYKVEAENKLTEQIDLNMFHGAKLSDEYLGKQFELIPKSGGNKNSKKRVFLCVSVNDAVNWVTKINEVMNWTND